MNLSTSITIININGLIPLWNNQDTQAEIPALIYSQDRFNRGLDRTPPSRPSQYYCLIFHFCLGFLLIPQTGHYCCSDSPRSWSPFLHTLCSCTSDTPAFWDVPPHSYPRSLSASSPVAPLLRPQHPQASPHEGCIFPQHVYHFFMLYSLWVPFLILPASL